MSDICVELGTTATIVQHSFLLHFGTALVAVVGLEMIFGTAFAAVASQLTTGHGDKRAIVSLDYFQIAYYKSAVEGDTAKAAQTILRVLHQFDSNFCNLHPNSPCSPVDIMRLRHRFGQDFEH